MPRMHILTASEQKAFDTPPMFSDAERDAFFQVSEGHCQLNDKPPNKLLKHLAVATRNP